MGAQEPEVAKEAPRRRAGIAHAEEAAVTLSAEDLEQPPPGRAQAHARPRHLAVSSPLPARCEPASGKDRAYLAMANKQVASAIKTQDRFVIKQALLMEGDLVDVINGAAVHQKMEFVGPAKSSANINHGVYKHKGWSLRRP